jgi:FMN reductase
VGLAPLIVGIGGSTSPTSVTNRLLTACLAHAEAGGARTEAVFGPELAALPIFTMTAAPDPSAERMLEVIRAADAVVIASPGYHGGMSGLVKNAVDHLELLRDDVRPYLDGRAVGVIVSAAGWQACGTTLVSVRSAVHALRGWPTPFGVTVNSAEPLDGADGAFTERIEGALRILAGQLLDFAGWQAAARATAEA